MKKYLLDNKKEYLSEFFGTALLLFIGIGAIALNFGQGSIMLDLIPSPSLRRLLTGILFAGGATLVVYSSLGKSSGGHINPAVTLSFWILKKIKGKDAIIYILMQFSGAIVGSFLALILFGSSAKSVHLGMTLPGHGYAILTVYIAEVVITVIPIIAILLFTSFKKIAPFTGMAVGIIVALEVFFEAPISGTSLNPARSLGPALIMGNLQYIWVYLSAPFVASVIISLLYKNFIYQPICGKLYHVMPDHHCIFDCGYRAGQHSAKRS